MEHFTVLGMLEKKAVAYLLLNCNSGIKVNDADSFNSLKNTAGVSVVRERSTLSEEFLCPRYLLNSSQWFEPITNYISYIYYVIAMATLIRKTIIGMINNDYWTEWLIFGWNTSRTLENNQCMLLFIGIQRTSFSDCNRFQQCACHPCHFFD